jgi:anoctamin-1
MSKNDIIDFVLVWVSTASPDSSKRDQAEAASKRRVFEKNLEDEGLFLEREQLEGSDLNFVKIHCPMEVLKRYTEILRLRMPMKEVPRS